jgi:hypothetical protein
MSEKPISPLRRRMIEDMTVRNFVRHTNDEHRHIAAPSYKCDLNSCPSVRGDTNDTKLLASDVVTIQTVVMVAELPQVR